MTGGNLIFILDVFLENVPLGLSFEKKRKGSGLTEEGN